MVRCAHHKGFNVSTLFVIVVVGNNMSDLWVNQSVYPSGRVQSRLPFCKDPVGKPLMLSNVQKVGTAAHPKENVSKQYSFSFVYS